MCWSAADPAGPSNRARTVKERVCALMPGSLGSRNCPEVQGIGDKPHQTCQQRLPGDQGVCVGNRSCQLCQQRMSLKVQGEGGQNSAVLSAKTVLGSGCWGDRPSQPCVADCPKIQGERGTDPVSPLSGACPGALGWGCRS